MNDYNNFIKNTTHFQPRLIVEIGGEDVSDRLVEDHSVVTDSILDTPTFNVYTTATSRFCLDNSDNYFNIKETPNFFTDLGFSSNGWQVPVRISVIFENVDAPSIARVMFVGYIENIIELPVPRWISLLVLDKSGLLQHNVVEDFGRDVRANISGIDVGSDYTDVVPVFNLPDNSAPVSRNSFSAGIFGGEIFQILPSLPLSGQYASHLYASLDENNGQLFLGAAPPDGDETILSVGFKTAYRYRTAEGLVFLLLEATGILDDLSDDEKIFAKSLIESPELVHTRSQWSSHGRPQVLNGSALETPVVRWIESDDSVYFLGGNRSLFRYDRRDDEAGVLDDYTLLSNCPDSDASILQFQKSGNDFYVLTVNTFAGAVGKLWKVTGGTAWAEISGANATGGHFYDHITQRDIVADNRKNFVIHSGYLYFVRSRSVARYQLSTGIVSDVYTGSSLAAASTTDYSWDFVIHSGNFYAFLTQRPSGSDNFLKIYEMGLDGSGVAEIFSETFSEDLRFEPACVSDVVVRGTGFYFVLTFSRDENRVGFADLCKVPVSGGSRTRLKRYENSLFSARSLVVHTEDFVDNIYAVEGTWISPFWDTDEYPTFADSGSLIRITPDDEVVDLKPAWRSFRSTDGRGEHTAFGSNLYRDADSDTLHCISGYGLLADPNADSIKSLAAGEVQSPVNWVWTQYGKVLSAKVPIFPTNDRTVWSLLSELARTVDFEVGFTSGQDEIETYLETNLGLDLDTKGYLFFRARSPKSTDIVLDESSYLSLKSELDTTLVFNYISVRLSNGQVWISADDKSIDSEGVFAYPLETGLLPNESVAWAEIIGNSVLERQKVVRLKTEFPLKFSPHLELGQYIELTSEYHSLDSVPYKITQVQHDTNIWQTIVTTREADPLPDPLFLPEIEDVFVSVGASVDVSLPVATGGVPVYMYDLEGSPSWLGFSTSTLDMRGTAQEGDWILTYKVTDADGLTYQRKFRLRVVSVLASPISLGGVVIDDVEGVVGVPIEPVQLPTGMGGTPPLQYDLLDLPEGFEFDDVFLILMGTGEEVGRTTVTYRVTDTELPVNSVDMEFDIVVEDPPVDPDSDILEWGYFQPVSVYTDDTGDFSGVVISEIDENLRNPSGASVEIKIVSHSSSIVSASLNDDYDVVISVSGLAGNASGYVFVSATVTIDGVDRTVERQIPMRLIFNAVDLSGYVTDGAITEFVTAGVTSGLVSDSDLTSATSGLVTAGVTSGLVSDSDLTSATSGLVTAGVTSGLVSDSDLTSATSGLVTGGVTSGLVSDSDLTSATSGLVTAGVTSGLVSDSDLTSATSGLVTGGVTSGLVSDSDLTSATSGLVTAGVTSGLVSDSDLTSATSGLVTGGVTSGLVSDSDLTSATSGLVTAGVTSGLVSDSDLTSATSGLVTAGVTSGLVSDSDLTSATSGLVTGGVTSGLVSDSDLTSATSGLATDAELASATSGLVTAGVTSGLATDSDLTSATSGLVTAGVTNTVVFPVTGGDISDFVTAGVTNTVVFPVTGGDISDFVTAGVTNTVVFPVTGGDISDFVTAGVTNTVVFPVTGGDISDFVTAGVTNTVVFPVTGGDISDFVTAGVTNTVVFPVTGGDISDFVTAGVTNTVVFPVTGGDISDFVTAGVTNTVVFPVTGGDISDFVTAGVTNTVVFPVTGGDISDFVTAGVTNTVVFPVTGGDISDFVTAGVTNTLLTEGAITDYVTGTLGDYVTESAITDYVTGTLGDYVTESAITDYVTELLTDYVATEDLGEAISEYISEGGITEYLQEYIDENLYEVVAGYFGEQGTDDDIRISVDVDEKQLILSLSTSFLSTITSMLNDIADLQS